MLPDEAAARLLEEEDLRTGERCRDMAVRLDESTVGRWTQTWWKILRKFEWASHMALETANCTDVPARTLVNWRRVTPDEVTRWFKADEFYHLALLELADWEVNALPFNRPTVAQWSDVVQREA